MSNALALVNLFELLTLPTAKELNDDLERLKESQTQLTTALFKDYDKSRPSHYPIQVQSYLLVEHIEKLSEIHQTLTFQGSLVLSWEDRRLSWEPKDYGNLDRLSLTLFDVFRVWNPQFRLKGVGNSPRPLIQFHNTAYTLTNRGVVIASVSVSVFSTCRIDLSDYPNDTPTCSALLYSPLYHVNELTMSLTPSFSTPESFFGNAARNLTQTAGFVLKDLKAEHYYLHRNGMTKNYSEIETRTPYIVNSVIRYELVFARNPGYYSINVAIPLFCVAIVSFIAGTTARPKIAVLWLLFCILLQVLNYDRMVESLPPDYTSTPPCVLLASFTLVETVLLLFYRIVLSYCYEHYSHNKELVVHLQTVERYVIYVLVLHLLIDFYVLFM